MSDFVFRRERSFWERLKDSWNSAISFLVMHLPKKIRKKGKERGKLWVMKWFIFVFAFIFTIEAIVYLIVIPSLQKPSVIWSGTQVYSSAELTRTISPLLSKSWMKFSCDEAGMLLSSVSGIEEVQIVKRFPDKVYINVCERVPVATMFISVSEKTVPVQIDKNGVLFSAKTTSNNLRGRSVPLVSGIPIENEKSGMKIPAKYHGLMEQISAISALSQNYFAAISEICVVPKETGNYELILYPIHSKTRILTGRELTEEALQRMMIALDVVNTLEPNVSEIDLRYGAIAYRK